MLHFLRAVVANTIGRLLASIISKLLDDEIARPGAR